MAETKQSSTGAKPSKRVLEKKSKKNKSGSDEPTKEEYAVAKYVRFKCPTKKTTFGHHSGGDEVHYFVASKAVDCLMESKWSKSSKKQQQPLFTDRQSCVDYMQELLMKGLFFRAKKLVPKKKADVVDRKKDEQKKSEKVDSPKSPKKGSKETEVKQRKKEKDEDEKSTKEKENGENEDEKDKEKSKKVKIRLDFHAEQLFIDGPWIYVWKYDPTPLTTWILGLVIVLGAIALCLFPLWPLQLRTGVYYLSLVAMGLLGTFVGLVVLRALIFAVVWIVTLGRHQFWLLPNLTEDCGFLESFKPFYSHKFVPPGTKPTPDEKKKRKKSKSESEDENIVGERAEETENVPPEDQYSESGSENENIQDKDGDSLTASQDEDDENDKSVRTSTEEEAGSSKEKTVRKRKAARRDDGRESNNGDYEFVETPN